MLFKLLCAVWLLADGAHGQGLKPQATRLGVLILRNPISNQVLGRLTDVTVIDLAKLPAFNVQATVDAFAGSFFASVKFDIDGKLFKTDNSAPFVLSGWKPTVGRHTLTVTVHRFGRGRGKVIGERTVTFNVVDTTTRPPTLRPVAKAPSKAPTNAPVTAPTR
jgi:hypothetical protein